MAYYAFKKQCLGEVHGITFRLNCMHAPAKPVHERCELGLRAV